MGGKAKGRPRNSKKDPEREQIRSYGYRLIDVGGPRHQELIKNGYIFNGIQLVKDENFVGERFPIRTRG